MTVKAKRKHKTTERKVYMDKSNIKRLADYAQADDFVDKLVGCFDEGQTDK